MYMSCSCCGGSKDHDGEIICHCNQITRDEIVEIIREAGPLSIPEVKKYLRDTITSNCAELNPTGKCCHTTFQAVIDEALTS
jgi:bacterioferritin-associated ferredoxin